MRFAKSLIILILALSPIGICLAVETISYEVPFSAMVTSSTKIYVNYSFNPQTQVLLCTTDGSMAEDIPTAKWLYKNTPHESQLPVFLISDHRFDNLGNYADYKGTLIINTEQRSSTRIENIYVACVYRDIS